MTADGGMADYLLAEGSRCVAHGSGCRGRERASSSSPFAWRSTPSTRAISWTGRRRRSSGSAPLGLCVVEAAILAGASEVVAVSRSGAGTRRSRSEAGASDALPSIAPPTSMPRSCSRPPADRLGRCRLGRRGGATGWRILVLGGHPSPPPVDLLDLTVREIALQGSVSHCFAGLRPRPAEAITAGDVARERVARPPWHRWSRDPRCCGRRSRQPSGSSMPGLS